MCLSLWKTVSFPTSIIFSDFILFFFFAMGSRDAFSFFLTLICVTKSSVPLSALCGGRFEEFGDSKLQHSWDRRAAGVVEQREDARQVLGFIKTQPPRIGTTTQRAAVCEWISGYRISTYRWSPIEVKYSSALIGISCRKVSLYLFRECHHSIPLYNPGCTDTVYAGDDAVYM